VFNTVQFLNLSIPFCPQVLVWLLYIDITSITMHAARDLDSQLTEIRDKDTLVLI